MNSNCFKHYSLAADATDFLVIGHAAQQVCSHGGSAHCLLMVLAEHSSRLRFRFWHLGLEVPLSTASRSSKTSVWLLFCHSLLPSWLLPSAENSDPGCWRREPRCSAQRLVSNPYSRAVRHCWEGSPAARSFGYWIIHKPYWLIFSDDWHAVIAPLQHWQHYYVHRDWESSTTILQLLLRGWIRAHFPAARHDCSVVLP